MPENAGNTSSFAEVELMAAPSSGRRATYGVGYWSELKTFDKNAIYNETITYFLFNDLRPDKKMKLIFTKSMNGSNFLTRKFA